MNREEKNRLTKKKIVHSALIEFSKEGYRGGSINDICQIGGVSKGIIYHYFETKDELYLTCVEECFTRLSEVVGRDLNLYKKNVEDALEEYFARRREFFIANPLYRNIFLEASLLPYEKLQKKIEEKRSSFDEQNKKILYQILAKEKLRSGFTIDDAIDVFRDFQGYANKTSTLETEEEFQKHEERIRKALNIFLYGVVAKKK